jgi:hypothetical protein
MLETDLHWTEHLVCDRCGRSGFAQISAGDDVFEDRADLTPSGFKVVPKSYGAIVFFCTTCNIAARP